MKNIKNIIRNLGYISSYCINRKLIKTVRALCRYFYTGWVSRLFFHFGKNVEIIPKFERLVGTKYISIGNNVKIDTMVALTAWDMYSNIKFTPEIIIGDGTCIGAFTHITSINSINIGKNVLMGKKVLITDNSHGECNINDLKEPPVKRQLYSKGKIVIEDNVWIGEKVSILPGVNIGFGAIIAANSVVTHDIPPFSVVAGVPAKVIKTLN